MRPTSPSLIVIATSLALLAVIGTASGIQTFTLDDDHELARPSAVDRYERTGHVSTSMVAPAMTVEIAEEHEPLGVRSRRVDAPYHYLRLRYNETLPAIVRIHIPSGYWHPQPQRIESIQDDATAELRPDPDGEVTVVTVRFDGRTDAVFPVPRTASWVFAAHGSSRDIVENETDVEIPDLGSRQEWHYVDDSRLTGNNATVKLVASEDLTIQYDRSGDGDRWLPVPRCSTKKGGDTAVCQFDREGVDDYTFILLKTEDPPSIRYKHDPGPMEGFRSLGDGIAASIDNLVDMLNGLFGVVAW